MKKFKVLIVLFVAIVAAECSSESDSSTSESDSSEHHVGGDENIDTSTPLFLSRYIQRGQLAEGRRLAEVRQPELVLRGIKSYSGYVTVDERYDSNMFFWYFPAKNNQKNAPVILWLQGGPGASSLYGLFMENGPVYINKYNTLSEREYSWNRNLNLLYIDNPVGAGFSFTNSSAGYLTNQVDIGINLFSALKQILQLFELTKNEFYISGESYAGKYIPTLAYRIFLNKDSNDPYDRINLKGFMIGNGVTDPVHQLGFGQLFHELGFIDGNALQHFNDYQDKAIALINAGQYAAALGYTFSLINTRNCMFNNLTGFTSPYNFLIPNGYDDTIHVVSNYLVNSSLSKYLHVGYRTFVPFDENNLVLANLANDILASVAPWLAELINNKYKAVIYSGMLDLLAGPRLIEKYLYELPIDIKAQFAAANATQWRVNGQIAGYERIVENLTFQAVRLAGHMVPHDQPEWAFDIMSKLTGTGKKL